MAERKLTLKQETFVAAYLGEAKGNGLEAARIAGYAIPEASATDNLENPMIRARIEETVRKYTGTAEEVLAELANVGMAPWQEFVEVQSRDKHGRPVKVRMDLTNKVKALELLGKYHQVFVERQQLDVNIRDHRVSLPTSTLETLFKPSDTNDEELHA